MASGSNADLTHLDQVRALEERAFNAWPALQTVLIGGWVLRLSRGYSKRANSLSALAPSLPLSDVIAEAEAAFDRHAVRRMFRLTPLAPPETDGTLERLGYRHLDPNVVMTAPVADAVPPEDIRIVDAPTPEWLDGLASAAGLNETARALHAMIVSSSTAPRAFASACLNGTTVAYGLGVYERAMVGLFDIIVTPNSRGRDYGRSISKALLAWGNCVGATDAYLQVGQHNATARNLYASIGFREIYRYHYRAQPA